MSSFIYYYNDTLKKLSLDKTKNWFSYSKFIIYFCIFYMYCNWAFTLAIIIILCVFPGVYFSKMLSFLVAGLSAYLFHFLAHNNDFMNKICGHYYHHQEKTTWINHLVEFVSDVLAAGGYLLVINYFLEKQGIKLLDNTTIIYFMIAFPMVHLINYHFLIPKSYHYYHHKNINVNYSPDLYDHIFNTNAGPYFENLTHMIPIFIVVGLVIILIRRKLV